jgi:hypothetical protein
MAGQAPAPGEFELSFPEKGDVGRRKLTLCAPNLSIVTSAPRAGERIAVYEKLGFRFASRRAIGGIDVATAINQVEVELGSVAELLELQRHIGERIVVEDGVLIVDP